MALFDLPPQPEAASDVAYTPEATAEAIVQHLCQLYGNEILEAVWEPCAGRGDFVRALHNEFCLKLVATEVDPCAASVVAKQAQCGDMFKVWPQVRTVLTNPPFSQATRLLRHCMSIPTCTLVVFLLNHSWIVPEGKGEEFRKDVLWGPTATLERQILLYPRIKFEGPARDGKSQDQREYALCCWKKEGGSWAPPERPTLLQRLEWR